MSRTHLCRHVNSSSSWNLTMFLQPNHNFLLSFRWRLTRVLVRRQYLTQFYRISWVSSSHESSNSTDGTFGWKQTFVVRNGNLLSNENSSFKRNMEESWINQLTLFHLKYNLLFSHCEWNRESLAATQSRKSASSKLQTTSIRFTASGSIVKKINWDVLERATIHRCARIGKICSWNQHVNIIT